MRTLFAAVIGTAALAMSSTSAFAHHNIQHSIVVEGHCAPCSSSSAHPNALAMGLQFATGQRNPVTFARNHRDAETREQAKAGAGLQSCGGMGVVTSVTATTVTVRHEPIAARHWPAMTMTFAAADSLSLKDLAAGDRIEFDLQDSAGAPTLTRIVKR